MDYFLLLFRHFLPEKTTLVIFDIGIDSGLFEIDNEKVLEQFQHFITFFIDFQGKVQKLLAFLADETQLIFDYFIGNKQHIFFECFETDIMVIFSIIDGLVTIWDIFLISDQFIDQSYDIILVIAGLIDGLSY